ncbi:MULTISPECIES: phosphotransferase enzyme family protein [Bacillus cereus group]|uniref:phosphotransferase enzyme family protein n=1 Tax=Bacillus cereus group TaxID=86661 RepID=UPI0002DE3949|nr:MULTISPECIES: aminoglycoside phosphotransferase family protein [Bacillus cereus group]MBJ8202813.1 phosphotransferase [Bacillus cereus]MDA2375682.1 aminoglycoside phosphotransferase family protein [Bacillus cereus]TBX46747.1 aminoglycoside phosphotransferase family protein [Bacillus thuringiensis]HDR8095211.1 phosphotransferase [Bacillus cereus]
MKRIIRNVVINYFKEIHSLIVEAELHKNSWHTDLHYKIIVNGDRYSARFMNSDRTTNPAFGTLSNEQLKEQVRFTYYLREHGIPFMQIKENRAGGSFTFITWNDEQYRFVLSTWIEGEHITHCTETMAEIFGKEARNIHDISSTFQNSTFQKKSHLDGYGEFIKLLENKGGTCKELRGYIELAKCHIECAYTNNLEFIVQTDLNPLNVLWGSSQKVKGIVDFESISYVDRVEGLAFLIKWYSRTEGMESHVVCPKVARAFLEGYGANNILTLNEYERLSSLLWLSGSLNWNFVKKTMNLMGDESALVEHLRVYKGRGERLSSLLIGR